MIVKFWTPERDELLRRAYASGGSRAAREVFPGKSIGTLQQRASAIGVKAPANIASLPRKKQVEKSAQPAQRLTREARLQQRIEAKKRELANLAAQRDGIAAEEARRAAEREARAKNRKTAKLERAYAATVVRADELRKQIVAVKPDFAGPVLAARPAGGGIDAASVAMPTGPLKSAVDKGDTDLVRKRLMNFVVPQLVRDLRCNGNAILACIEQLAKDARK